MLVILGFEAGDYQTAIRKLADLWARPSWRMACASLEHLLPSVPSAVHLWYDVADIAALREGELERSQATLVRMQAVSSASSPPGTPGKARSPRPSRGDLSQLVPDPAAPPAGISGRETRDGPDQRAAAAGRAAAGPAGRGAAEPAEREAVHGPADAVTAERSERLTHGQDILCGQSASRTCRRSQRFDASVVALLDALGGCDGPAESR